MATLHFEDMLDDEADALPNIRNAPVNRTGELRRRKPGYKHKTINLETLVDPASQQDEAGQFEFSYHASRHERVWIIESLGGFFANLWVDDVLRRLKGGKEANVYQCTANPSLTDGVPYLAAKVYRPQQVRNLKNDHLYREGRPNLDANGHQILDGRMNRAMANRTNFGRDLLHSSWIEHEFLTMQVLHQAGADVPYPYARNNNAILMEYIGGDNMPAPSLQEVSLYKKQAYQLFERVVHNIELMLANRRIHADLSAYNILYWDGEICLIDFPQAIDPLQNRNAYAIFARDVRRTCEYFARQGVPTDATRLAVQMWKKHGLRIKPDIHPGLLDDQDEQDRKLWQSQGQE
jgi:RIO kinase 1